jgi:hypothetical protein
MDNRGVKAVRTSRDLRFNQKVVRCSSAAAAAATVASGEAIAATPGLRLPWMHRKHYEAMGRKLPPKDLVRRTTRVQMESYWADLVAILIS